MDIDKLEKTYHVLLNHMKETGMSPKSCFMTEKMIKDIIFHKGEFQSYTEYYEKFIDHEGLTHIENRTARFRTVLRRIWAFDEYDHMPDKLRFQPVIAPDDICTLLPEELKDVVNAYDEILRDSMMMQDTKTVYGALLRHFVYEVYKQGAQSVDDISPIMTAGFFNKEGKVVRGNSQAQILKSMFVKLSAQFPHFKDLIRFIPTRKDVVNIHGIIPEDIVTKAKEIIFDDDSAMSLRDKVIIVIAIFTGMRGSDIAALTLDNIDWDNDCIRIIQSKTQKRLTLPLRAAVGNILYDYITKERPHNTGSRLLFFNKTKPDKLFSGRIVSQVVNLFFTSLGIDGKSKNRGLRALRHRLASALLSNGTEPAIISSILGHIAAQ